MINFDVILDLLVAAAGVYFVYQARKIMRTGEIRDSILVGKTIEIKKTSDVAGYIGYICPKAIVFGVIIAFSGLFQAALNYMGIAPGIRAGTYFFFFFIVVIFGVLLVRAQDRYLVEPTLKKNWAKKPEEVQGQSQGGSAQ